jgi:hypothetical protein
MNTRLRKNIWAMLSTVLSRDTEPAGEQDTGPYRLHAQDGDGEQIGKVASESES